MKLILNKIFSKQYFLNLLGFCVAFNFILISFHFNYRMEVEAQTVTHGLGTSGVIITPPLIGAMFCCNGIFFGLAPFKTSVAKHFLYIHEWPAMYPNPYKGLGLYQWWNYIIGNRILGASVPGGVCLDPKNNCTPFDFRNIIPPFRVLEMGVTAR